jgi:hypothetical protein
LSALEADIERTRVIAQWETYLINRFKELAIAVAGRGGEVVLEQKGQLGAEHEAVQFKRAVQVAQNRLRAAAI